MVASVKISVVILNNIASKRLACTEKSIDVEGLGRDKGIKRMF